MTRRLANRLQKLEGGRSEELFEIAPGLWLTGAELGEVLKAVDGETKGIPNHGQG